MTRFSDVLERVALDPGAAIIDVYNGSAEVYCKDYHSPLQTGHEG
ncbi:hypothetical protein [Sinorhizobium sp. BJ1]|nr:hypothetical protein [Sinorhizobium sp. BJ1]